MSRAATLIFAIFAYLVFFATFLYLIGFVGDLPWVPVTVDRGPASPVAVAVLVDVGLLALFGVQHSVMARPWFKAWWTRFVPVAAERSVYVLVASLVLVVLYALWRPIPGTVWQIGAGLAEWTMWGLFAAGWAIVLVSTHLISHFELFGLRQAWFHLKGRTAAEPLFRTPFLYRMVRHPLYTGFLIAFWATPLMSWGHLLLAVGFTAYILVAIGFEEHDLTTVFGDSYADYRRRVGKLIPGLGKSTR